MASSTPLTQFCREERARSAKKGEKKKRSLLVGNGKALSLNLDIDDVLKLVHRQL